MKDTLDFTSLPVSALDFMDWPWERIEPYYVELIAGCSRIFHRMDPQLGTYFDTLVLDVEPRPNKYPGDGFTLMYAVTRQSFILLNPTGCNQDVIGLIHEAGHAFYALETAHLDFLQIGGAGLGEFPAQTMELLALPYLSADEGGFYTPTDAARAYIDQLEWILGFFCSVGRAEAFRQWAYTHPKEAVDPAQYSTQWRACEARFFPAVDWRDLETECAVSWQNSFALFFPPFAFLGAAISQLGALRVWRNAQHDPAYAIANWRKALSLDAQGSSRQATYAACGAEYTLEPAALADAIAHLETQIAQLENEYEHSFPEEDL
ncbi:MAG: hypothetical protein JXR84_04965 [Anaerolineae bacterium]|nr:hypothetical protein [Anaerolineae bacterium]